MVGIKGFKAGVIKTYSGAHENVKRLRGYPSEYTCCICDEKPAYDWAYLGGDPAELTDPGTGCKFSLDPRMYAAMCRSCHRRMDFARITHCPQGHEYTLENTYWEKNRRGSRVRICKKCKAEKLKQRRAARLREG